MPHQHTIFPCLEQANSTGPSRLEQMFSSVVHHLAACPPPWLGPGTPCRAAGMEETPDLLQPHRQHRRLSWIAQKSPCCSHQAHGSHRSIFSPPCKDALGGPSSLLPVQGCREHEALIRPNPRVTLVLRHPQPCVVFPLAWQSGLVLKPRT